MVRAGIAIGIVTGLLLLAGPARAAGDPWFQYENRFFRAWSNASERRTVRLLEDLEEFRAAIGQVGNLTIPDDAPRVLVVITATPAEFARLRTGKFVAGFATGDGEDFVIVMPATGDGASGTIRHELAHVLLHYRDVDFPTWYDEGFAEIASAVELKSGDKSFIVGRPPERAIYNGRPLFPWETLFSEDFDPHKITDMRAGSSAYAQAWLMAHYATLGDMGRNAVRLQRYLVMVRGGDPQLQAFRMAFGFDAADAWEAALKDYSSRIPNYTIAFKPGVLDRDFTRRPAVEAEFRPVITYLERAAIALGEASPPPDPRAALPGRWGIATLKSECTSPLDFALEGDLVTVTMVDASGPGDHAARFRLDQDPSDPALLRLVPSGTGNEEGQPMIFDLRSADVGCWSPESENTRCGRVLARCGPAAPPRTVAR